MVTAFKEVKGVSSAEIDAARTTIAVKFDPAVTNVDAIKKSLEGTGKVATERKDEKPSAP